MKLLLIGAIMLATARPVADRPMLVMVLDSEDRWLGIMSDSQTCTNVAFWLNAWATKIPPVTPARFVCRAVPDTGGSPS